MERIRTEEEYKAALARLYALMNAPAGTPESVELDRLADVVEAYEDEVYPIEPATASHGG